MVLILLNSLIMGIRIDYSPFGAKHVVRVAGRLTSGAVVQFRKACHPIKASFVMDLSDLLYADDEGIEAITEIVDQGIQVQGASPFVRLLMDIRQRSQAASLKSKPPGDTR